MEELLPGRTETDGVTAKDNRLFVEAVIYRYRAGIPWRNLPERFGDWKNLRRRHRRWSEKETWERVFKPLSTDKDNEYAIIDPRLSAPTHAPLGQKRE